MAARPKPLRREYDFGICLFFKDVDASKMRILVRSFGRLSASRTESKIRRSIYSKAMQIEARLLKHSKNILVNGYEITEVKGHLRLPGQRFLPNALKPLIWLSKSRASNIGSTHLKIYARPSKPVPATHKPYFSVRIRR